MIRLPEGIFPSQSARDKLADYQREVTAAGDYPAQVAHAKDRFSAYNKKGNATFDAVKIALTQMCLGARRCCYCEDAPADEVEHIWPKDLYPERVFLWENYLYACGPCNSPKGNGFAVFQGEQVQEIARKKDDPIIPPPIGAPVLIDPRHENPLDFLTLDLSTWQLQPRHPETSPAGKRARYTINLLHLNDRPYLLDAREEAFWSYLALLEKYIHQRDAGDSTQTTKRVLRRHNHPTVWHEMQRQWDNYELLRLVFDQAPEARDQNFLSPTETM